MFAFFVPPPPTMTVYGPSIAVAYDYAPPMPIFSPSYISPSMQLPPEVCIMSEMSMPSIDISPSPSSNASEYEPAATFGGDGVDDDNTDSPSSSSAAASTDNSVARNANGLPVAACVVRGTTYFRSMDDEEGDYEEVERHRDEKEMAHPPIPEPLRAFVLNGEVDAHAPTDHASELARGMARLHLLRHYGLF